MRYTWAVVAQAPARRKDEVISTYFAVIYVAILLPVVGLGATAMLAARTDGQPARQHAVRYLPKAAWSDDDCCWPSNARPSAPDTLGSDGGALGQRAELNGIRGQYTQLGGSACLERLSLSDELRC